MQTPTEQDMPLPPPGPSREQVMARVKSPAVALIVVSAIDLAMGAVSLVMGLLGNGAHMVRPPQGMHFNIQFGMPGAAAGLGISVLIIFAAMKMMQLQLWGLALAGAILAVVPCISPCLVLGIPFGIWAIIVLVDADMKTAFES